MTKDEARKFYEALGKKIRDSRKSTRSKPSQQEMSDNVSLSRPSIVNIESGRQHVQVHVLLEIAQFLNISIIELIPSIEEMNQSLPESIKKKLSPNEYAGVLKMMRQKKDNTDEAKEEDQSSRSLKAIQSSSPNSSRKAGKKTGNKSKLRATG